MAREHKAGVSDSLNNFEEFYSKFDARVAEARFGNTVSVEKVRMTTDELDAAKQKFESVLSEYLKNADPPLNVSQLMAVQQWANQFTYLDRSKTVVTNSPTDVFLTKDAKSGKPTDTRGRINKLIEQQIEKLKANNPAEALKKALSAYYESTKADTKLSRSVSFGGAMLPMPAPAAENPAEKLKDVFKKFAHLEHSKSLTTDIANVESPFAMEDVEVLWNNKHKDSNFVLLLMILHSGLKRLSQQESAIVAKEPWFQALVSSPEIQNVYQKQASVDVLFQMWNGLVTWNDPAFVLYKTGLVVGLLSNKAFSAADFQRVPESLVDFILVHPKEFPTSVPSPTLIALLLQSFKTLDNEVRRAKILKLLTHINRKVTPEEAVKMIAGVNRIIPLDTDILFKLVAAAGQDLRAVDVALLFIFTTPPTIDNAIKIIQNEQVLQVLARQDAGGEAIRGHFAAYLANINPAALREKLGHYQQFLDGYPALKELPVIKETLVAAAKNKAMKELRVELRKDQEVQLPQVETLLPGVKLSAVYKLVSKLIQRFPNSQPTAMLVIAILRNDKIVTELNDDQLRNLLIFLGNMPDLDRAVVAGMVRKLSVENSLKIWKMMPVNSLHRAVFAGAIATIDVVPNRFNAAISAIDIVDIADSGVFIAWIRSLKIEDLKFWAQKHLNKDMDPVRVYNIFSRLSGERQAIIATQVFNSGLFERLDLQQRYAVFQCLPDESRKKAAISIANFDTRDTLSLGEGREIVLLVADDLGALKNIVRKMERNAVAAVFKELGNKEQALLRGQQRAVAVMAQDISDKPPSDVLNSIKQQIDANNVCLTNLFAAVAGLPNEYVAAIFVDMARIKTSEEVQKRFKDAVFPEAKREQPRFNLAHSILAIPDSVEELSAAQLVFLIETHPDGLAASALDRKDIDHFDEEEHVVYGMMDLRANLKNRLIAENTAVQGMREVTLREIAKKIIGENSLPFEAYQKFLALPQTNSQKLLRPYVAAIIVQKNLTTLTFDQINLLIQEVGAKQLITNDVLENLIQKNKAAVAGMRLEEAINQQSGTRKIIGGSIALFLCIVTPIIVASLILAEKIKLTGDVFIAVVAVVGAVALVGMVLGSYFALTGKAQRSKAIASLQEIEAIPSLQKAGITAQASAGLGTGNLLGSFNASGKAQAVPVTSPQRDKNPTEVVAYKRQGPRVHLQAKEQKPAPPPSSAADRTPPDQTPPTSGMAA